VVAAEDDGVWYVVPDPRHRRPGRGASLHPTPACLDLAERRRAFARALRRSVPLDPAPVREYVAAAGRTAGGPTGSPTAVTTSTSTVQPESGSDADEPPMSDQR